MKSKTTNLIELNLAVLIWGGTAMFAKGIALPLSHIMCVRYLLCAVSLLFFLFALKIPVRLKGGKDYAVVAIVGILLCFNGLTLFKALRISTAAIAILSFYTYPVFTALLEPFVFGEKLRTSDIVLAGFILIGILIMTPQFNLSNSTTQGVLFGVLSGLFFMARSLIIRKYIQEISSSVFMFWQAMVIGLMLIPWLFVETADYTPLKFGLLILLGSVFTAIPQTLFAASLRNLRAKTVGIISTIQPIYTAVLGYLIHDESMTTRAVAGGAIILMCFVFETTRNIGIKPDRIYEKEVTE